jgi:outer membrane lipase/esterase
MERSVFAQFYFNFGLNSALTEIVKMGLIIMKTLIGATVVLASMTLSANAATLADGYSSYWALGDSLSDTGNAFAATGGGTPGEPYADGRFSNGPVFTDELAESFIASGRATANFAFGGARAISDGDDPTRPIPDLPEQTLLFLSNAMDNLGSRPLVSIWFGANDIFNAVETGSDPLAAAAKAATNVANSVRTLQAAGVSDFVVPNLPDLGSTPLFAVLPQFDPSLSDDDRALLQAGASGATAAFNATLASALASIKDARITEVDVDGLFEDILADPAAFGITDVNNPCLYPAAIAAALGTDAYCGDDAAETTLFFDSVHPNSAAHGILAGVATEALLAAVPLPAGLPMLLVALGAFGVARRRQARAA